ncbi:MAG: hypothetical protein NTZ03_11880 [Actinobacteria bacterium]|nr:hypothetical protein [Actinomycetota bacterium]
MLSIVVVLLALIAVGWAWSTYRAKPVVTPTPAATSTTKPKPTTPPTTKPAPTKSASASQ